MFETRINKDQLLVILRDNRDGHRATYEAALEAYRIRMREYLEDMLEDITEGKKVAHHIALPVPEEHTADYDRAIRMLDMSLDEEVTIGEDLFEKYVLDNWEWQRAWVSNTTSYTGGR